MYIVIRHLNFNSKRYDECEFAFKIYFAFKIIPPIDFH